MNCRLCLSESEDNVSIFNDIEENTWMELIFKYLFLKVKTDDTYSTNICRPCAKSLKDFDGFYERIQKCQLRLQTMRSYERTTVESNGQGLILKKETDQDEYDGCGGREIYFDVKNEILDPGLIDQNIEEIDSLHLALRGNTSDPSEVINKNGMNSINVITAQPAISHTSNKQIRNSTPSSDDFDQYLKADNDNAKLLKMFMFGVSNIVEATELKLSDQINDLGDRIDCLAAEFRSNKKRSQQFNEPKEPDVETNQEENSNGFPKLPLRSVDEVKRFNANLQDPLYFDAALRHLQLELNMRTDSTIMYTRRLQLKKIIFRESVLSQFTWKIPSGKKIHIFSKLKGLLRLFVEVINSNIVLEDLNTSQNQDAGDNKERIRKNMMLDDRLMATYFMDVLKRDGKPKEASNAERAAKVAKTE